MTLSEIGLQPQKIKQFNKKGISTAEQLVWFLPRKYNDFTKTTGILPETETSCLTATVNKVQSYNKNAPILIAFCTVKQGGRNLLIKWFHQNYLFKKIEGCIGREVLVAGKAIYNAEYNNYSITTPDAFEPNIEAAKRIYPIYSKIAGTSPGYLSEKISKSLCYPTLVAETCPESVVNDNNLMDMATTLTQLHFPTSMELLQKAQERLLFDDLLYFALNIEWATRNNAIGSPYLIKTLQILKKISEKLPYELTGDQKNTINGMVHHIREGKRLNALVQGDVGCGKTIIAFIMMAMFVDSGYQAVIMAPTQVLARQHYEELRCLVEPFGFSVVYLGGSGMKASEKKNILQKIAAGTANFIVGTHSVLGKNVIYKNLAITVADEEHKFGVAQRNALINKAQEGVHSITMSATPIPRSLAQVIYSNSIQLYTIKTMPNGRKPIITGIATSKDKLFSFIVKQAKMGHQTYVVCPMIEANDDMVGVKSVEEVSLEYSKALGPYGIRVKTLTGKNSKQETENIVSQFKNREVDVLVATTVIEVGVNVPNTTTMVITNAERFGLSQLHQLRGRVGRGISQSYCVLQSEAQTADGLQRLNAMVNTTDGFKIAEEDLKIRGAGDFLGTKQSGDNKYMALMLAFPDKYAQIQKIAAKMIDEGADCQLLQNVIKEKEEGS